MALITESSISDWLQFDGTDAVISPCKYVNYTGHLEYLSGGGDIIVSAPDITEVDCKQVCNDSASIFAPHTDNLVTCGLWSTMLSAYTVLGPDNVLLPNANEQSTRLVQQFEEVGLNFDVLEYAMSYADTISSCLQLLLYNAKFFTFSDDGTAIAACTREVLFPLGSNTNSSFPVISALQTCLDALCSPITLNPDLAGVGVVSSFLIQSGIALIAFTTLLSYEWTSLKQKKQSVHAATVAALVDFHKVQCFFASTIQITALLLFRDSYSNSAKNIDTIGSSYHDFFDTSILTVLASSGFIPISLTLACISRYGRQSWYLISLSLVTMALATATLATSNLYAHVYGVPFGLYSSNMETPYLYNNDNWKGMNTTSTTCNAKGSVGHLVNPLCGSSKLGRNAIGASTVLSPWMWAVWANCMVWLFACIFQHWLKQQYAYGKPHAGTLRSLCAELSWTGTQSRKLATCRSWMLLSLITWSPCFGGQFYLFSAYFSSDLISQQWSFGQIIAVTVWVPSVVEYIYTQYNGVVEASKYRYPAPLRLTEASEQSLGSIENGADDFALLRYCKPMQQIQRARTASSSRTHPDCLHCYMARYQEKGS